MTTELVLLAWATFLGLLHAVATGQLTVAQHGLRYGMSTRDENKPLTGIPARLQRAFVNYMQTFPFFAVAVLIAHVAGRHGWLTITGAHLYFWARLVYVPLYATGVPVVRTVVFVVSVFGIVLVLISLT